MNDSTGDVSYPGNVKVSGENDPVDCLWVLEAPVNMTIEVKVAYHISDKSRPCKDFLQVIEFHKERLSTALLIQTC